MIRSSEEPVSLQQKRKWRHTSLERAILHSVNYLPSQHSCNRTTLSIKTDICRVQEFTSQWLVNKSQPQPLACAVRPHRQRELKEWRKFCTSRRLKRTSTGYRQSQSCSPWKNDKKSFAQRGQKDKLQNTQSNNSDDSWERVPSKTWHFTRSSKNRGVKKSVVTDSQSQGWLVLTCGAKHGTQNKCWGSSDFTIAREWKTSKYYEVNCYWHFKLQC